MSTRLKKNNTKILFLHNIIYPIRNPFFRKLSSETNSDIKVLFISETSPERKWRVSQKKLNFPSEVLLGFGYRSKDKVGFEHTFNPFSLINYLKEWPDILISFGWANPTNILYMFLSILRQSPFYIWVESTKEERTWKRDLFRPLVGFLIRRAEACIVPGTASRDYVKTFVSDKKTILIPNAVDNRFFKTKRTDKIKEKYVLFVGRLEKIKGIYTLVDAFKIISNKFPEVRLKIVGYGREEVSLKNHILKKEIENVDIVGHVPRKRLPGVYQSAEVLVLPSTSETWGFVINEGMAAGLPIIASDKVGAAKDLINEGDNGYTFKAGDVGDLAKKLEIVLGEDQGVKTKMGRRSQEIISKYTYDRMVKIFKEQIL